MFYQNKPSTLLVNISEKTKFSLRYLIKHLMLEYVSNVYLHDIHHHQSQFLH